MQNTPGLASSQADPDEVLISGIYGRHLGSSRWTAPCRAKAPTSRGGPTPRHRRGSTNMMETHGHAVALTYPGQGGSTPGLLDAVERRSKAVAQLLDRIRKAWYAETGDDVQD